MNRRETKATPQRGERRRGRVCVIAAWLACFVVVSLSSCAREERVLRVSAPEAERINSKRVSDLQAGGGPAPAPVPNNNELNAYAMSEGKRLYQNFNCVGCHANGG